MTQVFHMRSVATESGIIARLNDVNRSALE